MESKLTLLNQQNENIKQKLDILQNTINDNDDEKETSPKMTIQQRKKQMAHLQSLKAQDSTPPPTSTILHQTDFKAQEEETNNDDMAYINNSEKYGYDKRLHDIKNKYFQESMTKEQQQNLIIKLAMKAETLQQEVDEQKQTIDYLKKKQILLRQEMVQKINDNNDEYRTQMMALAKNNWSGIKEFIRLNEQSSYPLPYAQRFALATYYIATQFEYLKHFTFDDESELDKVNKLREVRNCYCHYDCSGDYDYLRNWQSIIELMEAFPIIQS